MKILLLVPYFSPLKIFIIQKYYTRLPWMVPTFCQEGALPVTAAPPAPPPDVETFLPQPFPPAAATLPPLPAPHCPPALPPEPAAVRDALPPG
ncbi:hypothetical protein CJ20_073 [Escherichia phage CJ20]|nr:hypothetical protein CJ20_073 [Escherichia phage CJ20]